MVSSLHEALTVSEGAISIFYLALAARPERCQPYRLDSQAFKHCAVMSEFVEAQASPQVRLRVKLFPF